MMTPAELKCYRAMYHLTQCHLAQYLCVTRNTVVRWENGRTKMNRAYAFILSRTKWENQQGRFV